MNEDLETLLAERVVQTLTPVVGADRVKSSVTIDYEPTSGETTQESYDPIVTAVLTSQMTQETVGNLEPAGIPGTPSNTPNSLANPTAVQEAKTSGAAQGIRSESKTFAVSKTTKRLLEPAGRIRRVAAAVLIDDAPETKTENGKTTETKRKRTVEEMKQFDALARAAIGFDAKRGDLFSVENVAFATPVTEAPIAPGKMQRVLLFAERWTGLLRYAAIGLLFLVVYLLLLRPVKKQVMGLLQSPANTALLPGAASAAGGSSGAALMPAIVNGASLGEGNGAEVQQAVTLKKQLATKVKEDPEGASRLIQNWIRESERKG